MDQVVEILTIALGGETFALPAGIVLEILDIGPVTPVPNAPAFVGNLINFRGRVAPLADLRLRCGMVVAAPTADSRIVVLEFPFDGEPILAAILADKVYEVRCPGSARAGARNSCSASAGATTIS